MTPADISKLLLDSFGRAVTVRTRRPGKILQVDFPAYLQDGDAATIFIEPSGRQVRVTDLGHTKMRMSYDGDVDEADLKTLARLSATHGFELSGGQISCLVSATDILPATIGLAQIESEADATIKPAGVRGMRAEEFRQIVRRALAESFQEKCTFDFHDETDRDGLFALDALISMPRPIGVAIVPGDIDAERAVATQLRAKHLSGLENARFIAIPRNINALSNKSRLRLMSTHLVPVPVYEDDVIGVTKNIAQLAS